MNGLGIVHRDIKPENVHIDQNGRVKLMDFGIAKTADLSLTRTGMAMGTIYYMSPEQVAGKPDRCAVGGCLRVRRMLFYEPADGGVRAVNGDVHPEAVMYPDLQNVLLLDPAPMVNAGIPPRARALVMRCVEKKAEDRPESFRHRRRMRLRRTDCRVACRRKTQAVWPRRPL